MTTTDQDRTIEDLAVALGGVNLKVIPVLEGTDDAQEVILFAPMSSWLLDVDGTLRILNAGSAA
jgi:hypothetical protein